RPRHHRHPRWPQRRITARLLQHDYNKSATPAAEPSYAAIQSAPNTRTLCHQYGPKQSPGVPRRPDKEAAVTNKQPVPDAILELGLAFWASKALLSAVELGLFTTLAPGPLTAETLTAKLGLQQRGTTDWLDALVCLGMLSRSSDGEYANTPATGLFLDRAKPSYLGGMLEMANARLYPFWGSLT